MFTSPLSRQHRIKASKAAKAGNYNDAAWHAGHADRLESCDQGLQSLLDAWGRFYTTAEGTSYRDGNSSCNANSPAAERAYIAGRF